MGTEVDATAAAPSDQGAPLLKLRTSKNSRCCECGELLEDAQVFPLRLDEQKKRHCWAHLECAFKAQGVESIADLTKPDCKHWRFLGRCSFGALCFFVHSDEALDKYRAQAEGKAENSKNEVRRWGGKRSKVLNGSRSFAFRRFLHDTFGFEYLRRGSGVVDVAGGKGELAFQLQNLSLIPCSVIDPRHASLEMIERRWRGGFYHRNEVWTQHNPGCSEPQPSYAPSNPRRLKSFFEAPLVSFALQPAMSEPDEETRSWWRECMIQTAKVAGGEEGLECASVSQALAQRAARRTLPDSGQADQEAQGEEADEGNGSEGGESLQEVVEVLRAASVIVGLHPDQAAEAIVDYAIAARKPFAVVPCCVFPRLFPDRRVPGTDRPVKSHREFLEFLQAKHPCIRRETLEFEGRNTVLFLPPSAFSPSSPAPFHSAPQPLSHSEP